MCCSNSYQRSPFLRKGAVRLRPWNGDLSLLRGTTMTLTYRGQTYRQHDALNNANVQLTYRGKQYEQLKELAQKHVSATYRGAQYAK